MNHMWNQLRQQLRATVQTGQAHWQLRSPRERRWLSVMIGALVFSSIWLLLVEPAWRDHQRLQRMLPQLRMQAAQMQTLAEQYRSLPVPTKTIPLEKTALEQMLQVQGIRAQRVAVTSNDVRLQFDAVPFHSLLLAIDSLQKGLQLQVHEANLEAGTDVGQVKGHLHLRRQGDE